MSGESGCTQRTADRRWQLSGTLGQPDSSKSQALAGGGWTLTGGFWPVTVDEADRIFSGGFES